MTKKKISVEVDASEADEVVQAISHVEASHPEEPVAEPAPVPDAPIADPVEAEADVEIIEKRGEYQLVRSGETFSIVTVPHLNIVHTTTDYTEAAKTFQGLFRS